MSASVKIMSWVLGDLSTNGKWHVWNAGKNNWTQQKLDSIPSIGRIYWSQPTSILINGWESGAPEEAVTLTSPYSYATPSLKADSNHIGKDGKHPLQAYPTIYSLVFTAVPLTPALRPMYYTKGNKDFTDSGMVAANDAAFMPLFDSTKIASYLKVPKPVSADKLILIHDVGSFVLLWNLVCFDPEKWMFVGHAFDPARFINQMNFKLSVS